MSANKQAVEYIILTKKSKSKAWVISKVWIQLKR